MPFNFIRRLWRHGAVLIAAMILGWAPLSQAETLKVAISGDYEPLAFKRDGELVGIEVDNAREIGRILGRRVKFIEMPLKMFIPSLEIGKVDVVMSGFSVTPEREQQVAFADPFMYIGQMAIVRKADQARFLDPAAISAEGVRIAVKRNTTGEDFVIRNFQRTALIQTFPDSPVAFNALRNNISDVYVHDAPSSWALAGDAANADLVSLNFPLTREGLAWAVDKRNKPLLVKLNAALQELRASGRLQEIQDAWVAAESQVR
jgi:ABC-type amino acid transport substrate-binding protein